MRAVVRNADVVVHVEPVAGDEGPLTRVRLAAARHGLGAHAIELCKGPLGAELDLHLEVEGEVSLGEADRRVRSFEEEVRLALGGLGAVHVHLEPVDSSALERGAEEVSLTEFEQVRRILDPGSGRTFAGGATGGAGGGSAADLLPLGVRAGI